MEFLFTNYPPVKTSYKTFADTFYGLIPKSSEIDIAVGYVSSDSLMELQKAVEFNSNIRSLNLVVGMHYFDRFTKVQYNAALKLHQFLKENSLGSVRLVTAFRYHGKLYSYSNTTGPFAGIIGSNNLSSIVDGGTRVYESSILLDETAQAKQMNKFIHELENKASKPIDELEIDTFNSENPVLDGQESVRIVPKQEQVDMMKNLSDVRFEIPLKTEAKSNLNCYFGKGRENKQTGLTRPRHWYEAELIVPMEIRKLPDYPRGKSKEQPPTDFMVVTDDGYEFLCQVNGGEKGLWNKNLRSSGDLTILGKWIKGRLENAGALKTGEPVTEETRRLYGRDSITMIKIEGSDKWYLDFEVKK